MQNFTVGRIHVIPSVDIILNHNLFFPFVFLYDFTIDDSVNAF